MIPLKDDIPSRKYPIVNTSIIILNVLIFFWELSLPGQIRENVFFKYGIVPYRFYNLSLLPYGVFTLFTSMFLHGGWAHLIGNMLYLYIFGDNVEDGMGHIKYLIFYLAAGVFSGLTQVIFSGNPYIPAIGASGAIAGVLGAYFRYYPRARILTIAFLGFFLEFLYIPSFFYIGLWFIIQLFSGLFSLLIDISGGIAWWAHIGGFLFGLIFARFFKRRRIWLYYYYLA